jgi:hypothetical protein
MAVPILSDEDVNELNEHVKKFSDEFSHVCAGIVTRALKRKQPSVPAPSPDSSKLEEENKRLKAKLEELETRQKKFAKHVFSIFEAGERKFCGATHVSLVPVPKKVEPKKKKASKKKKAAAAEAETK